jgi:S1-C subfamily serine protease
MRRRLPILALLAAVAALGFVTAGCGAGGSATAASDAPPGSVPTVAQPGAVAAFNHPAKITQIYQRDAPGVALVTAHITQTVQNPFGFPSTERGISEGSGVVLDKQGHIVTNNHVVGDAQTVVVSLSKGQAVQAKVVGTDSDTDLAVLKVDPSKLHLHPLPLGDSDRVQVGEPVVAIGNPFDLQRTITAGIVSAKARQIQAPNNHPIFNVLQTDAAINPGNSGGPLINLDGQVIGINSQIATAGSSGGGGASGGESGNIGIGFAIPSATVKRVVSQLITQGHVTRAYLGVALTRVTPGIAKLLGLHATHGALIEQVVKGGPAQKAGLRGGDQQLGTGFIVGGDLIVSFAGQNVNGPDDIIRNLARHKPGDSVQVTYMRNGSKHTTTVKLGTAPRQAAGSR